MIFSFHIIKHLKFFIDRYIILVPYINGEGLTMKQIKDITGAILSPGNPDKCQGNGDNKTFGCCCDECDYFLLCYPQIADMLFKDKPITKKCAK